MGLQGKVLVVEVAAGVASVRKDQELHPCWTQPVPASCVMDPPLDTAEPTSYAGGSSMITFLRKGKKYCTEALRGRSEKKWGINSPADTVSEEGGEAGALGAGAESILQAMEMPLQVVPL